MADISYSDGSTVHNAVIVIWDDLHTERSGYFRAFWAASPDATSGSPVFGYCEAGHSYRTIREVARDARRHYDDPIYRNGREVK